jgi:hypothetical protein
VTTASLELSKELFEVSGWDGLYKDGVSDDTRNLQRRANGTFPLYYLDYLLQKLPEILRLTHRYSRWYAQYRKRGSTFSETEADNPTDATCSLAIRLFKAGILTKETK